MTKITGKPLPVNKFALKAALRELDEHGVEIGTIVTVTWTVPENYATDGGRVRSHTGPLAHLDRARGFYEIKPSNKSPGHYRGYLLSESSTLAKAKEQDVKPVPTPVENPFLNLKSKSEPKQKPVKRPAGKPVVNPFTKGK